jgi:hypothetical protein
VVEDGAILGSRDLPGNGGLIITDEAFGDLEVVLEMKNDFGPDRGRFPRSTGEGRAYQAMIDDQREVSPCGCTEAAIPRSSSSAPATFA